VGAERLPTSSARVALLNQQLLGFSFLSLVAYLAGVLQHYFFDVAPEGSFFGLGLLAEVLCHPASPPFMFFYPNH
jgi:hypothetical protein